MVTAIVVAVVVGAIVVVVAVPGICSHKKSKTQAGTSRHSRK